MIDDPAELARLFEMYEVTLCDAQDREPTRDELGRIVPSKRAKQYVTQDYRVLI